MEKSSQNDIFLILNSTPPLHAFLRTRPIRYRHTTSCLNSDCDFLVEQSSEDEHFRLFNDDTSGYLTTYNLLLELRFCSHVEQSSEDEHFRLFNDIQPLA